MVMFLPAGLPSSIIFSAVVGGRAVFTNVGLTLLATALQTPGVDAGVTYVGLGLGYGTLTSALNSGTPYTSVPISTPLTNSIAIGQSITIINSLGATQVVTATSILNTPGATSITTNSFTPSTNFAIGSAVASTPAITDVGLQNESVRIAAFGGSPGGSPGESLNGAYFDPTTASNTYVEVGYYGGSTATATLGTGVLIARDIQFWGHTVNVDSATFNLDSIL